MDKKEVISLINAEIEWCKQDIKDNPHKITEKRWFIKGLKQALYLIKNLPKPLC